MTNRTALVLSTCVSVALLLVSLFAPQRWPKYPEWAVTSGLILAGAFLVAAVVIFARDWTKEHQTGGENVSVFGRYFRSKKGAEKAKEAKEAEESAPHGTIGFRAVGAENITFTDCKADGFDTAFDVSRSKDVKIRTSRGRTGPASGEDKDA